MLKIRKGKNIDSLNVLGKYSHTPLFSSERVYREYSHWWVGYKSTKHFFCENVEVHQSFLFSLKLYVSLSPIEDTEVGCN